MVKRIAIVDREKCKNKTSCPFICQGVCPINRAGQDCIYEGEDTKARIDEDLCIGCSICEKKCPFDAIIIINLPEELSAQPIHRFGENQFQLFSLPTPIFGQVTGIIGRNGIGKSTAIKILSSVLKPNLGHWDKPDGATYDQLLKFFKGSEAQNFFEKVKKGEIKISYKPQAVDLIPKQVKGKVKDLLKKVDEVGKFDEVVEKLELENFLDNDLDKLSGGELQRVAIAATVLKKGNFYVFDEPTSFLDIKQRLKLATFIKDFVGEQNSVMAIEHDLIVLDYLADLIQIVYGREGAYGIVSGSKPAKRGINTYLEGYLKEENIRFRDYHIKFAIKAPEKSKARFPLTSWGNIRKRLGSFTLNVEEGTINKGEIVGVLGANGIGKTSFVKMLAHVVKPDSGDVDTKIKVSYKPQYIDTDSEELVMNILADSALKYEIELIRPLDIKPLLMKRLKDLSGGELQRVAICLALSRDADLVLLDEPSAYLDVEQRLIVSKVIKQMVDQRNISVMVVDHDLLFMDYVCDKLMVFSGEPAKNGTGTGPYWMEDGMNQLLKEMDITLRRDPESGRPRINKPGSVKDREQKESGKYYYQ